MRISKDVIGAALALTTIAGHGLLVFGQIYFDTSLMPVSRIFEPPTIAGLSLNKAAEGLTPAQCAGSTILHRAIMQCTKSKKKMFIIPHAAIEHDGEKCGTEGDNSRTEYMIVVPGDQLSDPRTAVINGLAPLYGVLSSNARAINAFNVLRGLDPIHVGIEYSAPRSCGGKLAYPQNTIFFFLTPSPGGQDLNFGFAYLGVSEVGMVSVKEDEQLCLYKQSRSLGPGQAPFSSPTPSVTPGRNTNLPGPVFDLEDPAELEPCFPVDEVRAPIPTPIPPPSPNPTSGTTTPTPNRSRNPTPSTPARPKSNSPTPTPDKTRVPTIPTETEPSVTPEPTESDGATSTEKPTVSDEATSSEDPTESEGPGSSPSPSRSKTPDSSDDPACFPSEAKVQLSSGSLIPISNLRVGDEVLVRSGKFSKVFLFTHHIDNVLSKFVRVSTKFNATLSLSPGHYIPVNGQLKAAQGLQIGDVLTLQNGEADVIISRDLVVMRGLHNPQTLDGQIVVDGIVASTFTQAIDPSIAMSLLVPVKFLYYINFMSSRFGEAFSHGNNLFSSLLPSGSVLW